jgi:diaminohydroxyphosphoribosylaminopyrimidine deaminase/5-amino-6-(5-phosphoribosylamino)uracil reductase
MNNDTAYLQRCLDLAQLGAGYVAPNPMVGAVLVYRDHIIGEGYHRRYGEGHAEVNCVQDAENRAVQIRKMFNADVAEVLRQSRIYVSLEPCAHFGKTPPCADLIIEKKIPEVIIGCRDPFVQVDGKGIEKLRNAGVRVSTGVLEAESIELNKRFFTFHTHRRPYIILKWAQSANGKIAGEDGTRVLISNEFTNRIVHKWRSEEASIMVGTNTALSDDPSLTTRLWPGNHPVRIVLDMKLRLPGTLQLYDGTVKTIVFNSIKQEENNNISFQRVDPALPLAAQVCEALYHMNLVSVLVEGGAQLLQSFIDEGMWDEARVITNTQLEIKSGVSSPLLYSAVAAGSEDFFSDTIRFFKPAREHQAGKVVHSSE